MIQLLFGQEIQPNFLYLPFQNDIHSDHSIVFDAAASCTKSFRYPYIRRVMIYETISETEFSTNIEGIFLDTIKSVSSVIPLIEMSEPVEIP